MALALRRLAEDASRSLAYAVAPRLTAARTFARRRRAGLLDPELELVPALLDPDRLGVDVGANYGFWTLAMAQRARRVLAIEPIPELAAALLRRAPGHVRVLVCALSERPGRAGLRIPLDAGRATIEPANALRDGPPARTLEVTLERLDDLPLDARLGLVKIDVEGHELAVCRGAARRLEADRPSLVIEAEERHRPGAVADLAAFLGTLGYRGFFLEKHRLRGIAAFDAARHQPLDATGAPRQGPLGYVNNLLFVPPERQAALAAAVASRWGG
jgi:FkbM family methyltransferase